MDIITQGLLGAVMGQTVANKAEKKLATVVGAIAGLLADTDVLISSASDPLLNIEYHRHFTHALIFIPIGALIAALILLPFLRHRLPFARIYRFSFAGYALSGVLDACTSYGTHLLWPFNDERVAFHIISIVDPVFTLVLLVALFIGLRRRHRNIAAYGMLVALMYMGLGTIQMLRASDMAAELASQRGHVPDKLVVKPTIGNLVLWRSTYIADGRIYVDAIRPALVGKQRVYPGMSQLLFDPAVQLPELGKETVLYEDIRRFTVFSDGFVALSDNILGDIRYSMMPTSTEPLWGISIDISRPDVHVDYLFFRAMNEDMRREFVDMLMGAR